MEEIYYKPNHIRRRIVLMAVMIAIAVISRSIFFMTPQIKPMASIIILSATVLGRREGFVVGSLSALVSNFVFGQGPWTIWQMIGFGLVGYFAGLLFLDQELNQKATFWKFILFGFFAVTFLYGFIVDTGTAFVYIQDWNWRLVLPYYASGLLFNLIHGISTVVFLSLLAKPIVKKIKRVQHKYGL